MQKDSALRTCPVLHLARVTIEAVSPMSIGAEESVGHYLYDVALARDANGLPTAPGASVAGVMRHLALASFGPDWANDIFGWQSKYEDKGQAAKVWFSFGYVHNSDNKAVQGLITDPNEFDDLLLHLRELAPLERDHVAIDHRGTADEKKKFGRVAASVGTRLSFELAIWGHEAHRDALEKLVGLVQHPAFRLGGATRRGYGKVRLVCAGYLAMPLSDPAHIRKVRRTPPSDLSGFTQFSLGPPAADAATAVLTLKPLGPWRIGGGKVAHVKSNVSPADALPLCEDWIEWRDDRAKVIRAKDAGGNRVRLTVPASEIKGALAHRTLYHFNRLRGDRLIDMDELPEMLRRLQPTQPGHAADKAKIDQAIKEFIGEDVLEPLFGSAKKRDKSANDTGSRESEASGRAGRVLIDDAFLDIHPDKILRVEHNSIDRFTGGVRTGLLFSEEVVFDKNVAIPIPITFLGKPDSVDVTLRRAFALAIKDLCEGRLAIGAKRLGYCKGNVDGAEAWIQSVYGRINEEHAQPPEPAL